MFDRLIPRSRLKELFAYFTLRRALVHAVLFVYCLTLFLAFDFAYSSLSGREEKEPPGRIANAIYDHGFAANFDGYDFWGGLRYRLIPATLGPRGATL